MIVKNAARVFPEPVGAEIKQFLPRWIRGMANRCGGLNSENLE